jgi:hypothetical protein
MAYQPDMDRTKAYQLLDKISRDFESAGYRRQKPHRDQFEQLESAILLIFGNPNDPMGFHTKHDPGEGGRILRGLRHSFDEVSKAQKQLGEDALIWKKPHQEKAENFARFSGDITAALQKMSMP